MKKYVLNLLFGLFLGFGLSLSAITWKSINGNSFVDEGTSSTKEIPTDEASISEAKLILMGKWPVIEVSIKNNTDKELETIRGHINLYDAEGLFGNCWENFKNFLPHEEKRLAIDCWGFNVNSLPKGTKIESKIRYVWFKEAS